MASDPLPSWNDGAAKYSEREVAYDREFKLSPLADALDNAAQFGITLVSMKNDWKTVSDPA